MSSKIVLEDHAVSKTWKDSQYAKVRLPRIPNEKTFKDARFPARSNSKTNLRKELVKETNDVEDDAQ